MRELPKLGKNSKDRRRMTFVLLIQVCVKRDKAFLTLTIIRINISVYWTRREKRLVRKEAFMKSRNRPTLVGKFSFDKNVDGDEELSSKDIQRKAC